ncbi:MarR family transcriptional regulator [Leucobacter sp. CSA1]|uniref:MarR family transcriptional regulator n=1 Tax=Leucobacter chromiisoli TaxID=2796471 RepID=A0A934Q656_9MICO|nr:MarR family transcriptional regulator [Leucobacter chromiisoli]MBK0417582.1 MarR family transcriptional regulator [Leucobacter chromiisoli]
MEEQKPERAREVDRLALDLTRTAGRFAQVFGRVPGIAYSAIAWRVLSELEQGGSARVSELAQQQRVAQPSMTGLVQRLEGEGWVRRRPDPEDGRASLVGITEEGRSALDEYRRAAAGLVSPLLAELTEFDRATLARAAELMGRLVGDAVER